MFPTNFNNNNDNIIITLFKEGPALTMSALFQIHESKNSMFHDVTFYKMTITANMFSLPG